MELIRNFKKISKSDVALAGGKGASLGEMTQAGIPVPPGFVVLSSTFDQFIKDADLAQEIDAILDKVDHKEIHTVENASEQIQGLIKSATMPESIAEDIKKQFKNLNTEYVAVRSSATAEDGQEHAWAGQLDSFLNTTEKDLLEKVQHCWASLFTPRAIFYRFEKGLHTTQISVAVVVQKMVNSEISGIAFSVHPVTEDRNQLIIEAGFGLGEAIVSGQITPDSYVVEKESRRIIDKNVQTQPRGLYRAENGGNEWRDIPRGQGEKQVLSDDEILEFSKLILQIENHYGFPCDIEWAFEKGEFYVVQSRPITTLSNHIVFTSLANQFIALSKNQELSPPMRNLSIFVQTVGWNTEKYYRKYYADKTPLSLLITVNKDEQVLFMQLDKAKQLSREIFRKYWKNHNSISILLSAHERNKKRTDIIYKKMTYSFIKSINDEILVGFISKAKDLFCESVALTLFARDFDKEMCRQLLRETENGISQQRLDQLWDKGIISMSDSFEARRTFDLAELLKKNKSWNEIAELCQFFEANYNKIATIEETKKILKERYNQLIKNTDAEINLLKENKHKVVSERQKWLKTLTNQEKKLVIFFQIIIRLRDERKDILAKSSLVLFRIAQNFFKKVGLPQDLIYLYRIDELTQGTKYLQKNEIKLKERKSGYTVLVNYDGHIQEEYNAFYQTRDGFEKFYLEKQETVNKSEIVGQTGSPGVVIGKVKIIKNLLKEIKKFNEGDILVTGMTRPEFVPLMKKAIAIITDEGGITCHAAIIARELSKPCIIGTKIATQILKDGDLVEVDANTGIVKIINKAK